MLVAIRITCGPALLFALCLFLDFADPLVAGAWPVNPDRSVEGVSATPCTSAVRRTISMLSFAMAARPVNPVAPSTVRFPRSALSAVSESVGLQQVGYPALSDPPPLAEDHWQPLEGVLAVFRRVVGRLETLPRCS